VPVLIELPEHFRRSTDTSEMLRNSQTMSCARLPELRSDVAYRAKHR
jgi:hypothetical protein